MGLHNSLASSIALATLGSIGALATTAPYCVGSGSSICFKWGVPETAISSGTGNIYFQLRAPSSYSWAALGTGSRMSGSSMFLMYQDGAGNVTLSTRTGTGHTMPKYSRRSVTLLAGSGVVNGEMVANVQCADCTSVSLKGSSSWLSAWKAGGAINSKDASAAISQHDDTSTFQVDLSQASIKSDSNPFTSDGSNNGGLSNGGLSNGGLGPGGIISGGGGSGLLTPTLRQAHGILMMIVWVVLYPLGALLMPVLGKWLLHASFQTIAFLAMWIGLGMGYILASRLGLSQSTHSRLGIAVCALMFLQPIFGALHHANFKRKGRRGAFSHIHVWYGRALIILGIINGGLGLQLANTGMSLRVAYIALCAAIGAPFLLSIPWIERRKAKEARKQSVKRRRQARIATSDRSSSR